MSAAVDRLEGFLRGALGHEGTVALHEPHIGDIEKRHVMACLDSGWVSTAGPLITALQRELAAATGRRFAVVVVNGTAAQHVALLALGVRRDDLVICPAISFVATANAISHAQASPLFVDVEPDHLTLDPAAVAAFLTDECERGPDGPVHRATGRRVAGMVPVDIFGHPARLDELQLLADAHGLWLLEDAAEALATRYRGRLCGAFGRAAVLSFNGNKIVTAGGGGAVVTDDEALAARVNHLATTARLPHAWDFDHDEVGYNYRMPSLNAALCMAQLETLAPKIAMKRALHARYRELFAGLNEAVLMTDAEGVESNYWLNALRFPDNAAREAFLAEANARGIQARACWQALPSLSIYRDAPRAAAGVGRAVDLAGRVANLPSSPQLLGPIGG
ncbi:MAG: LegC family aminotransferase [Alphaproteobacteria bacterium]|nr:LegC family aminotransferase [Alphaproteobacteria bacterium]